MDMATVFNVGRTLKGADGQEYTLRKPTLIEQGQFSVWLEQRAHDAVDRGTAKEDAKDRRHAIIDRDAAQGKYEFDGPLAQEALWQPAGLAKLVGIVCKVDDETATGIVQRSLRDVAATLISRAASDPKFGALVLATLGLPTDWLTASESANSSSSSSTRPSGESTQSSEASATSSSCSSTPSSAAPTG